MAGVFLGDGIRQFFLGGRPYTYAKGEIVIGSFSPKSEVYYIETGYIKVYSISDDGDEYVHVILGHGDTFPLLDAYLDRSSDIFYEALSECLIWDQPNAKFRSYIQSDAEIGWEATQYLASLLQVYSDRLDNLEYKRPSARLAYCLLFLANRFGTKTGDEIVMDLSITHELIGNSINLARETVSRELSNLMQTNTLGKINHKIVIKNIEQLKTKLKKTY